MSTMQARILHRPIERDWREVYAFASKPENMPRWASGLAAGFTRDGEDWIADGGPLGTIRVRFAPPNTFGVIDHTVTLPTGAVVENTFRVVPNGDGAEVMFTLLRQPGMDTVAFEADAAHIARDLETLKQLMENGEETSS
ncbi:SRPBCC family protein [Rhizobium sp. TRM95111]|uniref:SRPBCC family protein n=1 Tax=Rhizobium alarense TaxID=2846851 RepID=UPI001F3DE4A9|nr:SRPBCC family protein [Rhizobium alarense]MCF3640099.1 SRPBCC family protein [Rhizobium alarense]